MMMMMILFANGRVGTVQFTKVYSLQLLTNKQNTNKIRTVSKRTFRQGGRDINKHEISQLLMDWSIIFDHLDSYWN